LSARYKGIVASLTSLLEVTISLTFVGQLPKPTLVGDYDGDTATVIWAPDMVEPFTNADEKHSLTPIGLDVCFSTDNERVEDFLRRVSGEPEEKIISAMQVFLLGALRDTSLVGKYSAMHDNSVYNRGYANPRTVKLGYK
jgi:RNA-dependent RNA polymerase